MAKQAAIMVGLWLGLMAVSERVSAEEMGFYVGGALGQSSLAVSGNYFDQSLSDIQLDDQAFAWRAHAGFQALPVLGLEVSYHRFGRIDDVAPLAQAELEADTLAVFGRGVLPIGPLHLFGKLGYHFYDADVSLRDVEQAFTANRESGQEFAVGAGAGFDVGGFTVRAEYEIFLMEGIDDLTMISVGASYSF